MLYYLIQNDFFFALHERGSVSLSQLFFLLNHWKHILSLLTAHNHLPEVLINSELKKKRRKTSPQETTGFILLSLLLQYVMC